MDIRYHASVFLRGSSILLGCLAGLFLIFFPVLGALLYAAVVALSFHWIGIYFGALPPDEYIPYSGFAIPVMFAVLSLIIYDMGRE